MRQTFATVMLLLANAPAAVILKSGALCGINDSERVQTQEHFPNAKVADARKVLAQAKAAGYAGANLIAHHGVIVLCGTR